MLETTVGRRSILLIVVWLTIALLGWVLLIALLLLAVALLLTIALVLGWVLLVALVVLIVRARHVAGRCEK